MYVSRAKWNAYEEVRCSGETNMKKFLDEVIRLNKKMSEIELTKKELHYIIKNYGKLCQKFGFGRVQSI